MNTLTTVSPTSHVDFASLHTAEIRPLLKDARRELHRRLQKGVDYAPTQRHPLERYRQLILYPVAGDKTQRCQKAVTTGTSPIDNPSTCRCACVA
jgi:hypothetical protein